MTKPQWVVERTLSSIKRWFGSREILLQRISPCACQWLMRL
ncbi:MAG: hypothetical protein ACMUEL_05970 [Flavobacteriales bacterium Tduv]